MTMPTPRPSAPPNTRNDDSLVRRRAEQLGQGECPDVVLHEYRTVEVRLEMIAQGNFQEVGQKLITQDEAADAIHLSRSGDANPQ